MSLSVRRANLVFHHAAEPEDVFIVGESGRLSYPVHEALATVAELIASAEARAVTLVEAAEQRAIGMLAAAQAAVDAVTATARQEGLSVGRAEAEADASDLLSLIRAAAVDGKAIRDSLALQSAAVVASATAIALRKLTAGYYEADPARTADVCEEALRAASGQEVLALRVNPLVVPSVQARVRTATGYIVPDESVEIGGCVLDLRYGTLDASLDARFSLMELALQRATGAEAA